MANLEVNLEDLDYDQDGADLEGGGSVRRPMNAFLIFCKRHRSLVREKYPHLENRSITKILGELWANLETEEKATYTEFAKQYKEAFMKANPDFKWSRLPSPPSRILIARPSQLKLPKLELGTAEPLSASPPCGITPGKLADETQMGGLSSLITPSTNKAISKPPKKRYLENGAFRSQPPENVANASPAVTPSTSAPPFLDPQATNDCSALLKLAEMCSIELVRDGPSPSNSNNKPGVINGRAIGNDGSTSTTSAPAPSTTPPAPSHPGAGTPGKTPTSSSGFSFSKFGKMMQQMAEISGSTNMAANSGIHAFSSTLPERRAAGQGADARPTGAGEDEPLDLCKEKILTASHQQLIDCIIDNILPADDGPNSRARGKGFSPGMARLPRSFPDRPEPNESEYDFKEETKRPEHPGAERKAYGSGTPFKKNKNARHADGPSHRFGEGAGDPSSPRKSQRSCKGKRYQAFMSEGVLQPAKERKLSSSSRKPSSSDGMDDLASGPPMRTRTPSDSSESVASRKSDKDEALKMSKTSRCSTPSDDEFESLNCVPTTSDPSGSRHKALTPDFENDKDHSRKRFKAGDFDLEESIAALPKCNFESLDRRKPRRQGSSNSSNSSRKVSSSLKDDKKQEQDNALDMGCLSEDSFEKTDSSSSESRGEKPILVGSQKRKARKRSITHLEPTGGSTKSGNGGETGGMGNLKLVALAEVATSEERMPSATNQNDLDSPTGSA